MTGVVIVDLGLFGLLVGAISFIRPLRFLGIPTRRRGAMVLAAAAATVAIGACLPAGETRINSPRSELDQFFPVYQFGEFHSVRVSAPRERVYRALKQVTAEDIFLFRTLVWLRRFGQPGPESILNPPPNQPVLDVAARTSFLQLAEIPNQEIVLGTLVAVPRGWRPSSPPTREGYLRLADSAPPGFAFAAMNFRLEDCGATAKAAPCTLLTTETRVYTPDAPTRRRSPPIGERSIRAAPSSEECGCALSPEEPFHNECYCSLPYQAVSVTLSTCVV